MENVTYEGVTFNTEWVKTKKESEFVEHEKHHFENDTDGVKKLKEIYSLITKPNNSKEVK